LSREGSLSCHTCCDTGPQFFRSHPKDRPIQSPLTTHNDNVDSIVSYFSKKLTKYQKNYSTIEKECLALLLALQHFDVYLNVNVHPILVFTDHNPLTFWHKMSNKNQRLTKWSLLLQEYDIVIQYIKGKDNVGTDALSRV
jgi:hypothetical protein